MKVLIFSTTYPTHKDPYPIFFTNLLVQEIAKLASVIVVAPIPYVPKWNIFKRWQRFWDIPYQEQHGTIKVYRPRYFIFPRILRCLDGIFMFLGTRRLMALLFDNERFDLIHTVSLYPEGLASAWHALKFKVPLILTSLGSDANIYPNYFLRKIQIIWALQKADCITYMNKDIQNRLIKLGANIESTIQLQSGVDFNAFKILDRQEIRKRLGLNINSKIVLYVSTLRPSKGPLVLTEAISILWQKRKDIVFLIIGTGPLESKVRSYINIHQLGNVQLLGDKPHQELVYYYNAANLFCMSSLSEGWPTVIMEAMACGTPIVATQVGGLPEMVPDNVGLLVPPNNPELLAEAIEKVIGQTIEQNKVRKMAEPYQWSSLAQKAVQIYSSVLSKVKKL